jgi:hypothetical protein
LNKQKQCNKSNNLLEITLKEKQLPLLLYDLIPNQRFSFSFSFHFFFKKPFHVNEYPCFFQHVEPARKILQLTQQEAITRMTFTFGPHF